MKFLKIAKEALRKQGRRLLSYSRSHPNAFMARFFMSFALATMTAWGTYTILQPPSMPLTTFLEQVEAGKVESATISNEILNWDVDAVIGGKGYYVMVPPDGIDQAEGNQSRNITQVLKAAGVKIEFVDGLRSKIEKMGTIAAPIVMVIFVMLFFFFQMKDSSTAWMKIVKDVKVKFKDVAGADEAKGELREVMQLMTGELDFSATKARMPRGVLLSGPPGTGKTLLAKALAGEAGTSFIAVSGSDFRSMWYGGSQRRVRALFDYARSNRPCIIFIDEFDAIGAKRSEHNDVISKESNGTLNQLLVEMDGFHNNEGITIIAATNLADQLDPAVTRPGRLDRRVEVGLPTQNGREAILVVHCEGRAMAQDVSLSTVARGTPGFSGADLANLVNEAAIFAARDGRAEIRAVDLEAAKNKVIMGLERKSLQLTEEDRRLTAWHEAGHALAACLTEHSDPVHTATIVPHGRALGMVVSLPERDRVSITLAKLQDDLVVAMAGRAAEAVVFGDDMITSGAESDIQFATERATAMVTRWGFSGAVGMVRISDSHAANDQSVKNEIRDVVRKAYDRARSLIGDNRAALDRIAEALLDQETISGDQVRALAAMNAVAKAA